LILNGISPRSSGRGGTNLGFADNGAAWFDNPAASVNISKRTLFEADLDLLVTDFQYSDPDNSSNSSTDLTPLAQLGFIRKTSSERLAYGVGLYFPAGFSESYTLNGPFPLVGPRRYESFGMLSKLLPGVSYKVNDQLSVGGTFGVGFSQVELEGPLFIQTGFLQGTPTLIDLEADGVTSIWSLGLQYELNPGTTLGICYQSESDFDLEGTGSVQIPLAGISQYDVKLEMAWPQSVGAGIRHELDERQTVALDAIWYDWEGAFDHVDLSLKAPTNPFFVPVNDVLPLDWRESVSIRTGYEYQLNDDRTLRFGYVYHRNPIPNGTLTPFLQAVLEHTVSVGYGWQWENIDFDLSYRFLWGDTENAGSSDIIGGDFSNSEHRAYAHSLALGILWGR
jgi:long-subunit fatty acid transport protein